MTMERTYLRDFGEVWEHPEGTLPGGEEATLLARIPCENEESTDPQWQWSPASDALGEQIVRLPETLAEVQALRAACRLALTAMREIFGWWDIKEDAVNACRAALARKEEE